MPASSLPFILDDGTVEPAWFMFMQSLWQRTGSAAGVDVAKLSTTTTTIIQDAATAMTSEQFIPTPTDPFGQAMMADTVPRPSADPWVAFIHEVPQAPRPDPLLALSLI